MSRKNNISSQPITTICCDPWASVVYRYDTVANWRYKTRMASLDVIVACSELRHGVNMCEQNRMTRFEDTNRLELPWTEQAFTHVHTTYINPSNF